ncbi:MAG TPA: response regulator [Sulfurimonas sp.]|nr:response regulator [Sulfurimonas sp.]
MEHLHDLMDLGKELKVLYVEDDENLRLETTKIIERIFDKVDVVSDGVEGFDAFTDGCYDLVITDIEMPRVNGIEMSRNIRSINKDTPIVVVSAYSNTDYFIDAITIGIDYYILKPIKMPSLIDTLFAAVKRVTDKRIADAYRQKEIKKRVQQASQNMLAEITNISPNPTIVYANGSITFMNRAFIELFEEEDLKKLVANEQHLWNFLNEKISIDSVIYTENDFIEQLDDFKGHGNKHKISLRTKKGRKIFFVFRNPLSLEDSQLNAVYTFNDITVLEYQKVQINQYNEYMNELMYTKYKSTEKVGQADIIDKVKF